MFLLPDPVTHVNQVSGACFLYFEEKLWLTLPSTLFPDGTWKIQQVIDSRNPTWRSAYYAIFEEFLKEHHGCANTLRLLKPLMDVKSFEPTMLSYASNFETLDFIDDLIAAAGFSVEQASRIVRYPAACAELVRHIHLERYLELGEDIEQLYEYCEHLFKPEVFSALLTKAYFFRLSGLVKTREFMFSSVVITNPGLVELLNRLPVERSAPSNAEQSFLPVAGWEIFKRLVSPRLDPLTESDVELISDVLLNRMAEVRRLKSRCMLLAEELDLTKEPAVVAEQMDKLLRTKVSREISELFQLDDKSKRAFLTDTLSDKTTWLACAAAIGGLLSGTATVTAGASIAALSNLGAKAFKAAAQRREKLRESDFTLIYTISGK